MSGGLTKHSLILKHDGSHICSYLVSNFSLTIHITLWAAVALTMAGCHSEDPGGDRDMPEAHLKAFTQDEIKIVLPVKPAKDVEGKPITHAWPDGGTTMVRITDAAGKEWDVYFDRRIGLSPAPRPGEEVKNVSNLETIYLNAYPSEPGSILVIHQKRFRDLVLSGIDH
jgi:hypothetical protein